MGGKQSKASLGLSFLVVLAKLQSKHFNNAMESIKLIDEIIIPYVQSQHKELGKPKQVALVIMDVFEGQITDDVFQLIYLFYFIIIL